MSKLEMPRSLDYRPDDELRLTDVWLAIVNRKKLVIGLPVLFGFAALLITSLMRPVWEAHAVVRIGQIGQVGLGGVVTAQPIEPVARAVERMKLGTFEDAVLTELNIPLNDPDSLADFYRDNFKVRALPNTELVEIKTRAHAIDEARRYANASADYLIRIHKELFVPARQRIEGQLALVKQQIEQVKAEREKLLATAASKDASRDERFMESVILANTLIQRDAQLRDLEQNRTQYEEQLSPLRTYATSFIDEPYVGNKSVSPHKFLVSAIAAAIGLLLGIFLALVLSSRSKVRASQP